MDNNMQFTNNIVAVKDVNGVIIPLYDVLKISTDQFKSEEGLFSSLAGDSTYIGDQYAFIKTEDGISVIDLQDAFIKQKIHGPLNSWIGNDVILDQLVNAWVKEKCPK